jgi:hypothetical protein
MDSSAKSFVVEERPGLRLHEHNLQVRLTFGTDGQPTKPVVHPLVRTNLEAEFLDVEGLGLVLVVHEDADVGKSRDHVNPPGS